MDLDLARTPFSRYGSYFVFSYLDRPKTRQPGLYLRTVRGGNPTHDLLRVELLVDGTPAPFTINANTTVLTLEAGPASVSFCIAEQTAIRIKGNGAGVRFTHAPIAAFDNVFLVDSATAEVNDWSSGIRLAFSVPTGSLNADAPWQNPRCTHMVIDCLPDSGDGVLDCVVEEFKTTRPLRNRPCPTFDECTKSVAAEFRKWAKRSPKVSMVHENAAELAQYLTWSSVVAPSGRLNRPAMLMSKNWMSNIWCWDACFNAMALAYRNPELAWDQFMLFFDHQDQNGALPDSLNDVSIVWNFTKPPVHGWVLRWMMERSDFITRRELKQVYAPLAAWTNWWMTARDDDGDGVPQYNHGNDSGWDNATVFDVGLPVESPDLSAYLVIQMDVLSEIADALGRGRDARRWKKRADTLLGKMISHSWRDGQFVAPRSGQHDVAEGDCLLPFVPIVLGKRLPKEQRKALVAGVLRDGRFLTEHGLATESPASAKFDPKGYWRGPIWAPATLLIVDGLVALGERGAARQISKRFCDMVLAGGMAENFHPHNGKGLCDPAYTWTASVFQILAHEYV